MDTLKDTMYQTIRQRLTSLDCHTSGAALETAVSKDAAARAQHLLRVKAIDGITRDAFSMGLIRSPEDESLSGKWALKRGF